MNKVTNNAVRAFFNDQAFKSGNTRVGFEGDNTVLYLHGHAVAIKVDGGRAVRIDSCGWSTSTTKERLNGVLEYANAGQIFQKNFEWFIRRGEKVIEFRDGMLVEVL